MLYASLLLHGLIIAIPGTPEPEIPPELEMEEQDVQITMLEPIIEPEPEIVLEEPEPIPEPPSPVIQPATPPPVVQQEQAPQPDPDPVDETPTYDPSGDRQAVVSNLTNVQGYTDATADRIRRTFLPRSARDAFFQNDNLIEGIYAFMMLNNVKLEGGSGNDVTSFDPSVHIAVQPGMTISQLIGQDYGGGRLYEIKTSEGEPVFYANAVPSSSGGTSTILFFWEYNPSVPPTDDPNN
ncbi:MAG: hypothetical protein AAGA75_03640 [Cyanobacteria bacterium P01_E01_bin.6]